ncbi:unnamed protein product, partial [Rotaria sp. Silwood2]
MESKQPSTIVFLLDCCRIRMEGVKGDSEAGSQSVSTITGIKGSYIVFACGPNQKTYDKSRDNRHGLFAHHLLKHITKPNLKIDEMMCLVCDGVHQDSKEEIFVHRSSSLRTSEVYFNNTAK